MKTFLHEGAVLPLTPAADVASGVGYLFGAALFGVAVADVASGAEGAFITERIVTVGNRLFWDATNKVVNKTSVGQQCVGVAFSGAANPSATVQMKIGQYLPAAT